MPISYGWTDSSGNLVPPAEVDDRMREAYGLPSDPDNFSYLYESTTWFAFAVADMRDGPIQMEWCEKYWKDNGRDPDKEKVVMEYEDDGPYHLDTTMREFTARWICGGELTFGLRGWHPK